MCRVSEYSESSAGNSSFPQWKFSFSALKTINKSNICTNNSFIYINISFILTNISFIYSFLRGVAKYLPRWSKVSAEV